MKRDMDVAKKLLLRAEGAEESLAVSSAVETYHVRLMIDAGIVDGRISGDITRVPHHAWIHGLTWAGHDFLERFARRGIMAAGAREVSQTSGFLDFSILLEWLKSRIRAGLPGM
jgi:hypothetical protein